MKGWLRLEEVLLKWLTHMVPVGLLQMLACCDYLSPRRSSRREKKVEAALSFLP